MDSQAEFVHFSAFPKEVRDMIWKEAMPRAENGEKSTVRVRLYWSPGAASELARLQLSNSEDEKNKTSPEVFDLRMTKVCHEARDAYLAVFPNTLPLRLRGRGAQRITALHFAKDTVIYIENYCKAIFQSYAYNFLVTEDDVRHQPMPLWTMTIKHLAVDVFNSARLHTVMYHDEERVGNNFSDFLVRYFKSVQTVWMFGRDPEGSLPYFMFNDRKLKKDYLSKLIGRLRDSAEEFEDDSFSPPELKYFPDADPFVIEK